MAQLWASCSYWKYSSQDKQSPYSDQKEKHLYSMFRIFAFQRNTFYLPVPKNPTPVESCCLWDTSSLFGQIVTEQWALGSQPCTCSEWPPERLSHRVDETLSRMNPDTAVFKFAYSLFIPQVSWLLAYVGRCSLGSGDQQWSFSFIFRRFLWGLGGHAARLAGS